MRGRPKMFVPKAIDNGGHRGCYVRPESSVRVRRLVKLVEEVDRLRKVKQAMETR